MTEPDGTGMIIAYEEPTLADVTRIARVHVRCWQEAYAGVLPDDYLAALPVREKILLWQKMVSAPDVFKRVTRVGGEFAGFILCGEPKDGAGLGADGEILVIYVLQAFQGYKIGRSLTVAAAQFWLSKGGHKLVVLFIAANAQAEAFYTSQGGTQVHEGTFELAGMTVLEKAMTFTDLARLAAYP
jgi:ribosomal protein S18 acetylase RimI-like enzyme